MEILLYGTIGDPKARLDANAVCARIRAASGDLTLRVNSPGGLVFDGLAIYQALNSYPGKVIAYVDGLAASIASIIVMAADQIIMAESAMMMIHDPEADVAGNASAFRSSADTLDKVRDQLVRIYASRTQLEPGALAAMMARETWMGAEQALKYGFVTAIGPRLKIAAVADLASFGFRNIPPHLKGNSMDKNLSPPAAPAPAAPQIMNREPIAPIATIRQIVAQAKLPAEFALDLAERGLSTEDVRNAVIDQLAERAPVITNYHPQDQRFGNPGFHAQAMADALYCRMSGRRPEGAAAEVIALSMTDMARELLEHAGVRGVRRMRAEEVLKQTAMMPRNAGEHTTSDFPNLLQAAGQRFLLDTFEAAASPLKTIARQRSANDFRTISALQLSGFGSLEQVPESGKIKRGTFSDSGQTYSVGTFAKIFSLSRQALINDDLGAFTDPVRTMARAAAETEAKQLAGLLNANSGVGVTMADTKPLFDATHNNLAATAAAPSVVTLDAGRQAMRKQMDADGTTPLNAVPRYILAGIGQETTIEQLLTTLAANQVASVNPFSGKLTPLIDPRLPAQAWSLWAEPSALPVLEYAYLSGEAGPQIDTQMGWDVLGMETRIVLDFGCGAVDFRGAYLNKGA